MMARGAPAAERARRLLALLHHFRPGQPLPIAAVAQATGASPEELAEDLRKLSLCGIAPYSPVDLVDVWLEGDGLVHTYTELPVSIGPIRLSPAEARALTAALSACGYSAPDPLVTELEQAAAPQFEAREIERSVRTAVGPEGPASVYAQVARAVAEREALRILYSSAERREPVTRVIQPHALGNERGVWYLSAFCERVGAVRTFRLDRIVEVGPTGSHFDPPERPAPPTTVPAGSEARTAVIRFAPGQDVAERDWPGATFERSKDGTVTARVPYATPQWVARRVAARLGDAEALGPPEIRTALVEIAKATLAEGAARTGT